MSTRVIGCLVITRIRMHGQELIDCHISDKVVAETRRRISESMAGKTDDEVRFIAAIPFSHLDNNDGQATALAHLLHAFPRDEQHPANIWHGLEELLMEAFKAGQEYALRKRKQH
jgi:hypothetical protein